MPISEVKNIDCMEGMKDFPDKWFDLAIVDPPYGIGEGKKQRSKGAKSDPRWQGRSCNWTDYDKKSWDLEPPPIVYFDLIRRKSKNQIIWGANHFISRTPIDSSCWIVWDKKNGESDFADCELAWTSFKTATRKFEWLWNGFQKQRPEDRIHPTQKPIQLYKWLLQNYAKQGDKILDTHMGSQSSRIAAFNLGFDYWGFEIDIDYYEAGNKRFKEQTAQQKLFL